jgi:hypothetical protein
MSPRGTPCDVVSAALVALEVHHRASFGSGGRFTPDAEGHVMRIALVALVALCAGVPARGRADPWQTAGEKSSSPRVVIGVRSGYSWGLGDVNSALALKDAMGFQIPVQLDLGLRLIPEISFGAYVSYGFSQPTGSMKELCDSPGLSCSASALRAGVQFIWYLSQRGEPSPFLRDPRHGDDEDSGWVGIGAGYDSIRGTISAGSTSMDLEASGLEAFAQLGVDFYTTQRSALGLYVQASVGRFTDVQVGGTSGPDSTPRLHEWITLGLRGEFGR